MHGCASRCILSKFYIKPQPLSLFYWRIPRCILSKFYIKPQLRLERELAHCVVSYRNSTSNHNAASIAGAGIIVVSYRNSTSNHNLGTVHLRTLRVVSYRNSTSNHNLVGCILQSVSLYLIEILHQTTTEARTRACSLCCILSKFYIKPQRNVGASFHDEVVSYRNSTSNHNKRRRCDETC